MLQQFSWGAFLLASFVLSFLWYGFVLLVCYRKEMLAFLGNGKLGERLPHRWEKGVEILNKGLGDGRAHGEELVESLMGKSASPAGLSVLAMGQLSFAGSEDARSEQVGLVADVIQELKLIFATLEKEAGSKLDFFRLLEKVKEDYGKIGAHPNIGSINAFIAEHVPFYLTADELENLWY
ncbi:hypothetical protein GM921_00545 [Pedobacter sp. LMG 31464]|uniref:Uncharacterized protein n=1 Tax=Pedobacter planticolens TaxID=2679964 RepID=A0A923DWX2_9SPHI|nr:hypothetical protein [Pedobacter planticolens]MBB2143958.1 hypothetical protein [Pedobacter planticolens]